MLRERPAGGVPSARLERAWHELERATPKRLTYRAMSQNPEAQMKTGAVGSLRSPEASPDSMPLAAVASTRPRVVGTREVALVSRMLIGPSACLPVRLAGTCLRAARH